MSDVLERAALRGAAPIIPVRRVARSCAFYTEVLGFALAARNREGTFAHVRRGPAELMLLQLDEPRAMQATSHYLSVYVWAEDVDALWHEVEPRLSGIPADRVAPIFTRPDGRREFHLRDPDGCLLFFGAPA